LRNPLNIIAGYSNVLTTALLGSVSEKTIKMLDRIKSSSDLMLQLINDLLNDSNIDTKPLPLQKTTVDLSSLIQENLPVLKELTDRKDIRLIYNQNNIPKINCDSNKVLQIILNLISEAINNAKKGDAIEILLLPLFNEVKLVVNDQGTLLPKTIRNQIAQPAKKEWGASGERSLSLGLNRHLA
jgi:K+-sensing histidine kinase KdpD